jgi:hypothetical protein
MYNAESVWGTAAAGVNCYSTNNNDKTTCSGDGNGLISIALVTGAGGNQTSESFRSWQHLYNAYGHRSMIAQLYLAAGLGKNPQHEALSRVGTRAS